MAITLSIRNAKHGNKTIAVDALKGAHYAVQNGDIVTVLVDGKVIAEEDLTVTQVNNSLKLAWDNQQQAVELDNFVNSTDVQVQYASKIIPNLDKQLSWDPVGSTVASEQSGFSLGDYGTIPANSFKVLIGVTSVAIANAYMPKSDVTSPKVASITTDAVNDNYKSGDTVSFTATLSEHVTAGQTFTITLNTGDVIPMTVGADGITATGTYTVGNTDNVSDLNVSAISGGTLTDDAGNGLATILPSPSFASQHAIVIDGKAPTVTGVSISDTSLKADDTCTVVINFSEKVENFSNEDVTVGHGSLSNFISSNDGKTWTATYTPSADTSDASNVFTIAATYNDTFGNAGTTFTSSNFVIETTVPKVNSVETSTVDGTYGVGETITLNALLSEPLTQGMAFFMTLSTGDQITMTVLANGTTATGNYTVGANDSSSDLAITAVASVNAMDAAGNVLSSTLPSVNFDSLHDIVINTGIII